MKFANSVKSIVVISALAVSACSTNPATGARQFTALMSPGQEVQVGAQEHEKIIAQFGLYDNKAVTNYVQKIGEKVTQKTERPDVDYKFYVLDSPIVNAFAVPGGYIYVTRGLMTLANNEAQLAAVLAHEAGHITGRHSAERYSRGVVTSLGAGILGVVIGSAEASQALGTGANLYLSSYSREQENEADSLGLRYMVQGGYDPDEMAAFLSALQAQSGLDARLAGRQSGGFNYFSTHPATADRVRKTKAESRAYQDSGVNNRADYLRVIDGMVYGDSPKQGFIRGQSFYHTEIDFTFTAPDGYRLINQPNQILASGKNGAVILFDMAKRAPGQDAGNYVTQNWIKKRSLTSEIIKINGMRAATVSFPGKLNNRDVTLRAIAIEFEPGRFARFQIAIPKGLSEAEQDALKSASYSFRKLTNAEKNSIKPYRLDIFTAKSGDTISARAARLPFDDAKEERFRALNALLPNEALIAGQRYKIITR